MILEYILSEPILLGFVGLMLFVALIDIISFIRNRRHINCKSIIINIGVLGTFTGIVWGLLDFDTQDITKSVPPLLEGVRICFFNFYLRLRIVSAFVCDTSTLSAATRRRGSI